MTSCLRVCLTGKSSSLFAGPATSGSPSSQRTTSMANTALARLTMMRSDRASESPSTNEVDGGGGHQVRLLAKIEGPSAPGDSHRPWRDGQADDQRATGGGCRR